MKDAPFRLAIFGLLITVLRIAMFVAVIDSGFGDFLGRIFSILFAIFIAGGVYISSFFVRHKKTRLGGIAGLLLFGFADLWFNEATVVFYTSSAQIVTPESTFIGLKADTLRSAMQFTALGFGALPTLGAAVLGWMQAGAAEVTSLNKPGSLARIVAAMSKIVVSWGVAVAVKLESSAKLSPQEGGQVSVIQPKLDWRLLTDAQRYELVGKAPREIRKLYPSLSEKSSENWAKQAKQLKVSGKKQ